MIKLKPHQTKVVKYMKDTDSRGIILFHGLGSGKTITSIAISKIYDKKVIVIVPASMRTQWVPELKKMNVDMKKYKVLSYEGFLSMVESGELPSLEDHVVLVDEAHRIRSPTGKISSTIVDMLQTAEKVILLTGTPMVNTPVDICPLVNAIEGSDIMPTSEKLFKEKFYLLQSKSPPRLENRCKLFSSVTCSHRGVSYKNHLCKYHYVKFAKRQKIKLLPEDLDGLEMKDWKKREETRIKKARAVANLGVLKPNTSEFAKYVKNLVSYYKPVRNINDFPETTIKKIKVPMSPQQNKLYMKAQKGVNTEDLNLLKKGIEITRKSASMNSFLNATRQISNTWDGNEDTPKLKRILKEIKKEPKPAIVYSNWIANGIKPLASMLSKQNISHLEFTGGMTDSKKKAVIKDYNDGKIDVLLLSSSGGEGLDLKNTRQIHIMEPHWNDAKISQVIGRGIRYKSHESLPISKRHVTVFNWISTPLNTKDMGTDEYLYNMSEKKLEEMKAFLETSIKTSIENTKTVKKPTESKSRGSDKTKKAKKSQAQKSQAKKSQAQKSQAKKSQAKKLQSKSKKHKISTKQRGGGHIN